MGSGRRGGHRPAECSLTTVGQDACRRRSSNPPLLAVFFVALFPQFVPDGAPVLPSALAMAGMVVAFDLVWYSALAYFVARTRRAFARRPWLARAERLTGGVLLAPGVRLAMERR